MDNFNKIFEFVTKTNPTITKEELTKRMAENKLFAMVLCSMVMNTEKI